MTSSDNPGLDSANQSAVKPEAPGIGVREPVPPPPKKKRKGKLLVIGVAGLVVLIAVVVYYIHFIAPYESTDDAFIDGYVTMVSSRVPGQVAQLLVTDNQEVKAGDVLVEIDPRDYEASLATGPGRFGGGAQPVGSSPGAGESQ